MSEAIVAELRQALGLDDSRHARINLRAALDEIPGGDEYAICRETIRRVLGQLAEAERIIGRAGHMVPGSVSSR